jgi:[NiFe] hydrogenase diaphorase moiety large subunit
MPTLPESTVAEVCGAFGHDRGRLLDILHSVQPRLGSVADATLDALAADLAMPRVDVAGVVSFYSFLSDRPRGQVVIRLCNDVPDRLLGADEVGAGLEEELGIHFGETTPDGLFSLEHASCIGMSDQAPAALFNDVVVPNLGPGTARRLVREIRQHLPASMGSALPGAPTSGACWCASMVTARTHTTWCARR